MEGIPFNGNGLRLGPRIYVRQPVVEPSAMDHVDRVVRELSVPSRILPRADSTSLPTDIQTPDCSGTNANSNVCEKPVSNQAMTIPIVLGIAYVYTWLSAPGKRTTRANILRSIPLVAALGVLLYLHRRSVKKMKQEDAMDPHKGMDFGLGDRRPQGKRKSSFFGGEKAGRPRQMSMDMDMSTPYLLPPALQNSRESLHSLARTLQQTEDPYRQVAQYPGSEAASVRSFPRGHEGSSSTRARRATGGSRANRSIQTQNMRAPSRQNTFPEQLSSRQGSFPRQASPASDPFKTPTGSARSSNPSPTIPESHHDLPPVVEPPPTAHAGNAPYPSDDYGNVHADMPHIPEIQEPAPVAQKSGPNGSHGGLPTSPRPQMSETSGAGPYGGPAIRADEVNAFPEHGVEHLDPHVAAEQPTYGLGLQDVHIETSHLNLSPPQAKSLPSSPRPVRDSPPPAEVATAEPVAAHAPEHAPNGHQSYDDGYYDAEEYERQAHPQDYHQQDYPQQDYHSQEYQQHDDYYQHEGYQQGHYQEQHDDYHQQDGHEQQNYHGEHDRYQDPQQDYQGEHDPQAPQEMRRRSVDLPGDHSDQLGVPQFDSRRLSVGFRPLPPDELLGESEDPEFRAMRIRSFYKEYFDEHRGRQAPMARPGGNYHEDYDAGYQGEGAYFDPASNAFVMPYSQPVTRRAMTPPPSASRFRRGPPPPRGAHGSVGGMSLPGGRGHFRPGSSTSNQSRWGPRPGSSASGRGRPGPKKQLPAAQQPQHAAQPVQTQGRLVCPHGCNRLCSPGNVQGPRQGPVSEPRRASGVPTS